MTIKRIFSVIICMLLLASMAFPAAAGWDGDNYYDDDGNIVDPPGDTPETPDSPPILPPKSKRNPKPVVLDALLFKDNDGVLEDRTLRPGQEFRLKVLGRRVKARYNASELSFGSDYRNDMYLPAAKTGELAYLLYDVDTVGQDSQRTPLIFDQSYLRNGFDTAAYLGTDPEVTFKVADDLKDGDVVTLLFFADGYYDKEFSFTIKSDK